MNKKLIVVLIGFLWAAIAAGVIMSKQATLRTGKSIFLKTVPVDPRDFLRGDYVVLRYEISTLELTKIKSEKQYYNRGEVVFVKIEPKDRFWEAVSVGSKKDIPGDGIYLRGRVKYYYSYAHKLGIDYGIESYFVPEGEGKDLEKSMRGNKSPVEVEAIVDAAGRAIIKKVSVNRGG